MGSDRGRFVVLEGLDGAGTTTQSRMLEAHLRDRRVSVVLTREPTDEPVGALIRKALSGGLAATATGGETALSEEVLCLLFAADRIAHSARIEKHRAENTHVVCDRYVLSSIVYQSTAPTISPERVIEVNHGCSVPDVTFLLEVPVDECLRRLEERNDSPTIYEKKHLLERIDRAYEATRSLYEKHFGPLVPIDGTQPADAVHAEITRHLAGLITL